MRGPLDRITTCELGVAVECAFRCKMCYFWKRKPAREEVLNIAQWKTVISRLGEFLPDGTQINFSGPGEVLQRENIAQLLYACAGKFRVAVTTNGFFIDESFAAIIARTVASLVISIDGIDPKTHDGLRGIDGAFRRAWGAVDYMRKYAGRTLVTVAALIAGRNLRELVPLARKVEEDKDIAGIRFQAVTAPFDGPDDPRWFETDSGQLWPKDNNALGNVFDELIARKKSGHKIVNSENQLQSFRDYFSGRPVCREGMRCEKDRVISIDTAGDLRICEFCEPVGNVCRVPLDELWNSAAAQKQKEKVLRCREKCHLLINCFHD